MAGLSLRCRHLVGYRVPFKTDECLFFVSLSVLFPAGRSRWCGQTIDVVSNCDDIFSSFSFFSIVFGYSNRFIADERRGVRFIIRNENAKIIYLFVARKTTLTMTTDRTIQNVAAARKCWPTHQMESMCFNRFSGMVLILGSGNSFSVVNVRVRVCI